MDGDVVLFNRQPSLHKLSIMAHQVCGIKNICFFSDFIEWLLFWFCITMLCD